MSVHIAPMQIAAIVMSSLSCLIPVLPVGGLQRRCKPHLLSSVCELVGSGGPGKNLQARKKCGFHAMGLLKIHYVI